MPIGFVDKDQVETYRSALNDDAGFQYATSKMTSDILLRVGQERCFIEIRQGHVPAMSRHSGEYVLRNSDTQIGPANRSGSRSSRLNRPRATTTSSRP